MKYKDYTCDRCGKVIDNPTRYEAIWVGYTYDITSDTPDDFIDTQHSDPVPDQQRSWTCEHCGDEVSEELAQRLDTVTKNTA
jgi:DNA-directed RNA polymerase subunit RPC12/RpoP